MQIYRTLTFHSYAIENTANQKARNPLHILRYSEWSLWFMHVTYNSPRHKSRRARWTTFKLSVQIP